MHNTELLLLEAKRIKLKKPWNIYSILINVVTYQVFFIKEIQEYDSLENAAIIIIYDRIATEVYLEKLSQMMDRN